MTGRRALITQDHHSLSGIGRAAANDEVAVPLGRHIPLLTLPDGPAVTSCAANDDWIEADLPVSINVLAEEVLLLDQFLRDQILALFD
jgi:hypothetical protein